jgi:hypothetical protein
MLKIPAKFSRRSQTEQIRRFQVLKCRYQTEGSMQREQCYVSLIYRTIGAARGRAARGRPVQI